MKNFMIFNETEKNLEKEIKVLQKALQKAIKIEGLKDINFNVILVDNSYIRNLNKTYRKIDKETDVISFALEDEKTENFSDIRVLGDIYISIDKCLEQSISIKNTFEEELCFLAIHGFLHLLGYDHLTKEEEEIMFNKQDILLGRK